MKKLCLIFSILFSTLAHADLCATMDLDLTCKDGSGNYPHTVKIVADGGKTTVTIDGKPYVGEAMSGGTEGGPFYSQYFDNQNGIRINFFEGDIAKLGWNTRSIPNATTIASFTHIATTGDVRIDLSCEGKLGWK